MLNVLIIDDDEKLAQLVSEYCARYNIEVTEANLPSTGLAILKEQLGADDYLPKPFEPRELVARINSIAKRKSTDTTDLRFEGLHINQQQRTVMVNDKAVDLTTMEYQLLLLLASVPGKDFNRDDILNQLKGTETELFSRSVDILISRLRNKLKPVTPIKTVYGSGYAFVAPADKS
jgi:OmpR family response regulator RpaB